MTDIVEVVSGNGSAVSDDAVNSASDNVPNDPSYEAPSGNLEAVETTSSELVSESVEGGEDGAVVAVETQDDELMTEEMESAGDNGVDNVPKDGRLSEQVFETVATIALKQKAEFPTGVKPPGLTSPDVVSINRHLAIILNLMTTVL